MTIHRLPRAMRAPSASLACLSIAFASAVAAQTQTPRAPEPFVFATNWFAQGEHGGYYQAKADGAYEACGLDVTIEPGGPRVDGRTKLIAGRVDAYMGGNLLRAFSAVREGIPSLVVAAHFQKEPQILMSHPNEGLDAFDELLQADAYIISDSGMQSFFPWMASQYGFDAAKRKPYTFNSALFIADPRTVQQGYLTSEPYAIEAEAGFAPNVFLLADYGFDSYATTVEVMAETAESRADAVRCFVEASSIGWAHYLYGDASAADALILADNPDMTQEQLDHTREKMIEYGLVDSGDAETMGIGAMTSARIEGFHRDMVDAGVIADDIDVADVYSLDFANTGAALAATAALKSR